MNETELIPHLFKTEYRKIISVLCKLFGIKHIEIAEDITNDTFLLASESWGIKGIHENPTAWLYTVAKNKTKDYLKRNQIFNQKVAEDIRNQQIEYIEIAIDLSDQNIQDSQLQMIFAICNPINNNKAQIALALRILCGFGIEEIANALLSTKESINKSLFRAKTNLRENNVDLSFPSEVHLEKRLDNVLSVLYLLFNEGYYSATASKTISKDLCFEAMRLLHLLIENKKTNLSKTNALLALFCFHASRFEARINENGDYFLYADQKLQNWDLELIAKGEYYLHQSAQGNQLSKYHIEAGIAFWHTKPQETKEKWESILQLYNRLLQIEYSPITALNRTYALAKAKGREIAVKEALKINLNKSHLYHSLLAELYEGLDHTKQISHLELALQLSKNEIDKKVISKKLGKARL